MERVITAIKAQKRNPNRVSIDLDGEYAFGLSRIVAAWLKTGDRLTEEKIQSYLQKDAFEVAYQNALDLLNHRPRSEQEIRQRLIEKGFSTEQTDQVVEKLKQANLIKDDKFARMWIESRNEFHPRSKNLLRYELKKKGIAEEHIEQVLENAPADHELATRAGVQYARRLEGLDWETFRNRLSGYLARRGFSYGTIAPVVKSIWQQVISGNQTIYTNEEFEK